MKCLLSLILCFVALSAFSKTQDDSETLVANLRINTSTLNMKKDINLFLNSMPIEVPKGSFDPKLKEVTYLKKENCKMFGVMRTNVKPESIKEGTGYKFFQSYSLPNGSTVLGFRRSDSKNLLLIECRSGFITVKSITKNLQKEFDGTFTLSQ